MDGDREHTTRTRAYKIWEQDRAGDPAAHWFQAERELAREAQGPGARGSGETLPEHWLAAIESLLEKMTTKARLRVGRLGRS